MNFIINHVYLLALIGVCLIAIRLAIKLFSNKSEVQPSFSQPKKQEPIVEEVEEYTIVFTFIDGTTKKYTCEEVDTGDGYFELSGADGITAYVPFNQVKHAEYE